MAEEDIHQKPMLPFVLNSTVLWLKKYKSFRPTISAQAEKVKLPFQPIS